MTKQRMPFLLALAVLAVPLSATASSLGELRATAPAGAYTAVPDVPGGPVNAAAGLLVSAGGHRREAGNRAESRPIYATADEARDAAAERAGEMRSQGRVVLDSGVTPEGGQYAYWITWVVSPRMQAAAAGVTLITESVEHRRVQRYTCPPELRYPTEAAAAAAMSERVSRLTRAGFVVLNNDVTEYGYANDVYYRYWIDFIFTR